MESLKSLELIITNAKKSLGRPYSVDTVNEKKLEIRRVYKEFKELPVEDNELVERFSILKKEAIDILEQHLKKREGLVTDKRATLANLDINELSIITKLVPKFSGKSSELHDFVTNSETVALKISNEKKG